MNGNGEMRAVVVGRCSRFVRSNGWFWLAIDTGHAQDESIVTCLYILESSLHISYEWRWLDRLFGGVTPTMIFYDLIRP